MVTLPCTFEVFGPWLDVHRTWTKKSDMDILIFVIDIQKSRFEDFFSCLTFSLFFSLWRWKMFVKGKFKNSKTYFKTTFLCHGPLTFVTRKSLCLSYYKTCWTTAVDNVGLNINLLKTSSFMVNLTFVSWCKPKWSWNEFIDQPHINLEEQETTS